MLKSRFFSFVTMQYVICLHLWFFFLNAWIKASNCLTKPCERRLFTGGVHFTYLPLFSSACCLRTQFKEAQISKVDSLLHDAYILLFLSWHDSYRASLNLGSVSLWSQLSIQTIFILIELSNWKCKVYQEDCSHARPVTKSKIQEKPKKPTSSMKQNKVFSVESCSSRLTRWQRRKESS